MLAQVLGADDEPVTIHRTYLTDEGQKAAVKSPKKLMTPLRKLENVAVRLRPIEDGWLGVAEGIETAYCADGRYGAPVWACVSAGLLKTFRPPAEVKLLAVYGDNDASYTGQTAAYELARLVRNTGIEVKVLIPETVGTDWADHAVKTELREVVE
jgi:putative DNA primase/helicase